MPIPENPAHWRRRRHGGLQGVTRPDSKISIAYQISIWHATHKGVTQVNFFADEDLYLIHEKDDTAFLIANAETILPITHETLTILKNFINFINCRECVLIESDSVKIPEHMRNRGVSNPPKGTTIVTITDKLVRYINSARAQTCHGELDISFWVRGHWRRLRSSHWTHKRGQLTWVHPYIKGGGVLHGHDYKLRKLEAV